MAGSGITQVQAGERMTDKTIDVDSTYKPESGLTLDQHREQELAKIEQPKFGAPTPRPEPAEPVEP